MPHLKLTCFGPFSASVDGQPPTGFATDKVRALLVYLALEAGQAHRRSHLAGLLWPEIAEKRARNNLRLTLHRLRQSLDQIAPDFSQQVLTISRHTVQFNGTEDSPASVDVLTFQRLLAATERHPHEDPQQCSNCLEQLVQAAGLYQGELLAGLSLADTPGFEEWLILQREMLQQRAVLVFSKLVEAYEAQDAYEPAYGYAERLVALDPYREEAHRYLMRLLAWQRLPDEEQLLTERYSGNPLALKLVADTVQDLFLGDLGEFLSEETLIFDDVRQRTQRLGQ